MYDRDPYAIRVFGSEEHIGNSIRTDRIAKGRYSSIHYRLVMVLRTSNWRARFRCSGIDVLSINDPQPLPIMGTDPDAGLALRRRERAFPIERVADRAHPGLRERGDGQQPFHAAAAGVEPQEPLAVVSASPRASLIDATCTSAAVAPISQAQKNWQIASVLQPLASFIAPGVFCAVLLNRAYKLASSTRATPLTAFCGG